MQGWPGLGQCRLICGGRMHVLAFLWYLESLNDHREQPGVAHVEPWSRAALGGTARSSQVRLRKG